jgi:hypothetical protein
MARKPAKSAPRKGARSKQEPGTKPAEAEPREFAEATVRAVAESTEMDETAAYMRRGRVLSSLTVDTLNLRWTAAFKKCIASRDPEGMRVLNDLSAELRLRGLDPPADTVKPELDAIQAEIAAAGPDNPGIRDAIRRFFEARNKPQA